MPKGTYVVPQYVLEKVHIVLTLPVRAGEVPKVTYSPSVCAGEVSLNKEVGIWMHA